MIIWMGANRRIRHCWTRRVSHAAVTAVVFGALFAGSVFSQPDTAYIPFVVNADARVTASQGIDTARMSVEAHVEKTLAIYLGTTSVRRGAAGKQASVPLLTSDTRGNISLRLPEQPYRNAEITVHSVNGRRVMQRKVDASVSGKSGGILRSNVAPGVYLLSVKGTDGQSFTSRLAHRGGALNVNVSFGAALPVLGKEAFAANDAGAVYNIRVSADGYKDSAYSLALVSGVNAPQNITLVPLGGGDEYESVLMPDGKYWMKKNLNVVTDSSWCYNNSANNCAKYGRLYAWNAAKSACAGLGGGWHLPSDAEWGALMVAVNPSCSPTDHCDSAGTKLKAKSGWYNNGNGTDDYGFSALPGGFRDGEGSSNGAAYQGIWWSATEYDAFDALGRYMYYVNEYVATNWFYKFNGLSVRCVRGD